MADANFRTCSASDQIANISSRPQKEFVIYKFTSPSGKSYVGQTNDYARRMQQHKSTKACRGLSNAIAKYGWDSFMVEILKDGLTLEEANHWEVFYIQHGKTISPFGYNLNTGGANATPSDETRKKIGAASKGNKHSLGHTHSEDAKKRIGEASMGNKYALGARHTEDAKSKIGAAAVGNTYGVGYSHTRDAIEKIRKSSTGRTHSAEARTKISTARTGMVFSDEHRANIGAAQVGKKVSMETRMKMSAAHIKRSELKRSANA